MKVYIALLLVLTMSYSNTNKLLKQISERSTAAEYNKVPEHLAYFLGQGHALDCLNRCKTCVKESFVKGIYDELKKGKLYVPKDQLLKQISEEIGTLKKKKSKDLEKSFVEKSSLTKEDKDPNNLFRVYFDMCFIFSNAFYA